MSLCLKESHFLAESVVKPYLDIVAQEVHEGATTTTKRQKLALSNKTMHRRCLLIATSLKEIVLANLFHAPRMIAERISNRSLRALFDRMSDINCQVQFIVYMLFYDTKRMKIADRYRFCLSSVITALCVIFKVENYFSKHGLSGRNLRLYPPTVPGLGSEFGTRLLLL